MTTVSKTETILNVSDRQNSRKDSRARELLPDGANSLAMLGDLTMIVLGLIAGFWLRFQSGLFTKSKSWVSPWMIKGDFVDKPEVSKYAMLIGVGAVFLLSTFLYLNLYRRQNLLRFERVGKVVIRGSFFWLFAYLSLSLVLDFSPPISRLYVVCSFGAVISAVLSWRALFHRLLQTESLAKALRLNVLIVGWNRNTDRLFDGIKADKSHPYEVVGCISAPNGRYQQAPPAGIPLLGSYEDLAEIARREVVDMIVLADLETSMGDIIGLTNFCERELIQFKVIPSYFQILISGLHLDTISGVPIMGVAELPLDHLANRILKRTLDIVGALVGLALSAPIILIFGTLIYKESPGSIFYTHTRTGRNGRSFRMIKLRSMKLGADKQGGFWTKKNDDRRLKIGAVLRRYNLDEVPQFWNVLKGEMSLVGPRPESIELAAKFRFDIPHYGARLASKPGITGWAQVHGLRGDTDLAERVRYDLYYLENWSVWLDFQIMLQTFTRRAKTE